MRPTACPLTQSSPFPNWLTSRKVSPTFASVNVPLWNAGPANRGFGPAQRRCVLHWQRIILPVVKRLSVQQDGEDQSFAVAGELWAEVDAAGVFYKDFELRC